ncbi:MAG: 23S rRNA (adenine(1618)-N(6))-methyltransferase RlmF [Rikenellaceae bacterium]
MKVSKLHKRNKHQGSYPMRELAECLPSLKKYIAENEYGTLSINFFDAQAVKCLNQALLKYYYGIEYWSLPKNALTPAIPGRAEYIHHLAEFLGANNKNKRCLEIGVGASCIYPIIGTKEYSWSFVASDIELKSLQNSQKIIDNNPSLKGKIKLRHQASDNIFKGIITPEDYFDISICNPPFHDSAKSADKAARRKLNNLKGTTSSKLELNFKGTAQELWCEGGEKAFIIKMIDESTEFKDKVQWFTTLVSKGENLKTLKKRLKQTNVAKIKVLEMSLGNKISRILAWSFTK